MSIRDEGASDGDQLSEASVKQLFPWISSRSQAIACYNAVLAPLHEQLTSGKEEIASLKQLKQGFLIEMEKQKQEITSLRGKAEGLNEEKRLLQIKLNKANAEAAKTAENRASLVSDNTFLRSQVDDLKHQLEKLKSGPPSGSSAEEIADLHSQLKEAQVRVSAPR